MRFRILADGTNTQTEPSTDIATYRQNRPMGRLSEILAEKNSLHYSPFQKSGEGATEACTHIATYRLNRSKTWTVFHMNLTCSDSAYFFILIPLFQMDSSQSLTDQGHPSVLSYLIWSDNADKSNLKYTNLPGSYSSFKQCYCNVKTPHMDGKSTLICLCVC